MGMESPEWYSTSSSRDHTYLCGPSGALRTGSMAFEATLWQNLDQLYAK